MAATLSSTHVTIVLKTKAILQVVWSSVITLHILNIPAVWFRYSPDTSSLKSAYTLYFSVSSEGKIPTWYSSSTLLVCSILLAIISADNSRKQRPYSTHWIVLTLTFALMSLDEATSMHEKFSGPMRSLFDTSGPLLFAWVIPGLTFVFVFGLFYLKFLTYLSPRTRNLFLLSGAIYILGVLGMEMVGSAYFDIRGADLRYGIIASVEEVFEMSGIALFIFALLDYLKAASTVSYSASS